MKISPKIVYIPIIGLFIAIILFSTNNKIYDVILREKHAVIYMLLAHVLTTEILVLYLLINYHK